ncbi:hypothetical protein OHB54_09200 [Streptomyces sp. NBC_01007]|nr:hypothetical protein OHB54_09200 [Streptomyces sp. NBC_01007]
MERFRPLVTGGAAAAVRGPASPRTALCTGFLRTTFRKAFPA